MAKISDWRLVRSAQQYFAISGSSFSRVADGIAAGCVTSARASA
jgi:hypothetical protein